jgi:hypothetical protein
MSVVIVKFETTTDKAKRVLHVDLVNQVQVGFVLKSSPRNPVKFECFCCMREYASHSQWHSVLMHLQIVYNVRLIQAENKEAPGTMTVWLQGRAFEAAVVLDFVLKALETEVSINVSWLLASVALDDVECIVGATRFGDR